jgi:cytochrome c oxidase assembly protein subunit 15
MQEVRSNPWLHRYAIAVALSALGLIAIGGLVTSHGVGMAVPDWPTSFGYNMFALPFSLWLTGGVFHEHTHRQWASIVGVLVVLLTRWLGGRMACRPLLVIGGVELLAGFALPLLGSEWKGGGYFLSGIGGVVLLAGIIWARHEPAPGNLPKLGWWAFWLVQFQGLLGGLRVVLDAHVFAGTKLGLVFGIFHGCLGQVFFVLLCVIALMTSRWWLERRSPSRPQSSGTGERAEAVLGAPIRGLLLATTVLIFLQLILGATMRHQHAGLAISDFPLAHGQWWPDMSAEAIQRYNAQRTELVALNPITAAQVALQMAHRIGAGLVLVAVTVCFIKLRRGGSVLRRGALLWLLLVLAQAGLGAWTIWSNKAADVATLHVVGGALSLATGFLITLIASGFNFRCCSAAQNPA